MTIGKRIKAKRKEAGLTQTELALRMGYTSKSAISSVENDKENLTAERIDAFAAALHCNPIDLYVGSDSPALADYDPEPELLGMWRKLSDHQKELVLKIMKELLEGGDPDGESV